MTSATPEPNWYDVLDVDPGATTEEIDRAWRDAIADLTPADRRFRLYNRAAEVLLDPQRRADYDATLAETEPEDGPHDERADAPAGEPVEHAGSAGGAGAAVAAVPSLLVEKMARLRSGEPRATPAPARSGRRVPGWLIIGLAILTALSVGLMSYLWTQPSEGAVAEATATARTAAERAAVPVLSFDYRTLDQDQADAHDYLTPDYRSEYDRFFDGVVKANAKQQKTVVDTEVIASAVVRAGEDRADILLFINQPRTNRAHPQPEDFKNQATFRMERVGDQWLVDCIITDLTGRC